MVWILCTNGRIQVLIIVSFFNVLMASVLIGSLLAQFSALLTLFSLLLGKTEIQPMLIEVNFNASIDRCCKYQPHLVNDFFETMFLEKEGEHVLRLL